MLLNNRIIFEDDTTLLDKSIDLSTIISTSVTLNMVAVDDYLYLGSDLPFNHRYFEMATVNTSSSVISVEILDGNAWVDAVDVLDQTIGVAGKTLSQSGIISWSLARNTSWGKEDTTEDIPALASLKIYNMYWARMKVSASLLSSTSVKYVGHKFANDEDMFIYYPDLATSQMLTSHTAGKTTWNSQHIMAAEEIILKLRKDRKVVSSNQVFDWTAFNLAAIHKCAEIAFRAFGADYKEAQDAAKTDYYKAYSGIDFAFDQNADGELDFDTEVITSAGLFRT